MFETWKKDYEGRLRAGNKTILSRLGSEDTDTGGSVETKWLGKLRSTMYSCILTCFFSRDAHLFF